MIPKVLMFTLAIPCLTTSNLPWFVDLTFQVPLQSCSLQHWTLLSQPDTSTTMHHLPFCSSSLFFLELFLPFSQQHFGYPQTWGTHSPVSYLFVFLYCSWDYQGKNSEVLCYFLLLWAMFCQNSPPLKFTVTLVSIIQICFQYFILDHIIYIP